MNAAVSFRSVSSSEVSAIPSKVPSHPLRSVAQSLSMLKMTPSPNLKRAAEFSRSLPSGARIAVLRRPRAAHEARTATIIPTGG